MGPRGVTLLEMVVAMVVVSILSGIGYATYRSTTEGAHDRAAQTLLETVAGAQGIRRSERGAYATTTGQLANLGVDATFASESTAPGIVSQHVDADGDLHLATLSGSGRCLTTIVSTGGDQGEGVLGELATGAACTGAGAAAAIP